MTAAARTPGPSAAAEPTPRLAAGPGSHHIRIVDKPAETVGARVSRLRQAQGWTQEDLAFEAGLSQAAISLIEIGRRGIHAATLYALAETLGVSADDLWLGEDDEEPAPSGHVYRTVDLLTPSDLDALTATSLHWLLPVSIVTRDGARRGEGAV